jgi:ApbE superfamily uncharacterized protein (UPF0280 family)
MEARRNPLPGERWHFQHGPIDLVIGASGDAAALHAAHEAAWARMQTVLRELVGELPLLRSPVRGACALRGTVARRMWAACRPHAGAFITPMAAVAGAVAQELIGCYERDGIERAWVNNGGDIALHLARGASVRVGVFSDLARSGVVRGGAVPLDAGFAVDASMPVRGIATSGWRGRSFSRGIADSVTVLAATAAIADAAATIIANAVDTDDPRIERAPANRLRDDTDLGDLLVTTAVPELGAAAVGAALAAGRRRAEALRDAGLIHSAVLVCQHRRIGVEPPAASAAREAGAVLATFLPA